MWSDATENGPVVWKRSDKGVNWGSNWMLQR